MEHDYGPYSFMGKDAWELPPAFTRFVQEAIDEHIKRQETGILKDTKIHNPKEMLSKWKRDFQVGIRVAY